MKKPLNHYKIETINIFSVANDLFPRFRRRKFRICNKKNCRFLGEGFLNRLLGKSQFIAGKLENTLTHFPVPGILEATEENPSCPAVGMTRRSDIRRRYSSRPAGTGIGTSPAPGKQRACILSSALAPTVRGVMMPF